MKHMYLTYFGFHYKWTYFRCQPALEDKNATREKKDGAVAAWNNVSWVIESQLHQLGQSPSRTIARRHFNAYHTATFASPCVRAPTFVNWDLTQYALEWWSCLARCFGGVELSCLTIRHHRRLSDDKMCCMLRKGEDLMTYQLSKLTF